MSSASVVPLHVSMAEVERAWERYDAAAKALAEMYRQDGASFDERFRSAMRVAQLWREFIRQFNRLPPGKVA